MEKVGAKLMKTEEAIDASHIIVMAVPKDFYDRQPLKLLEGKTVIDVSNRATLHRKEEVSQAEYLQSLLPKSAVIKSFNVLSAYALESGGLQGKNGVIKIIDFNLTLKTLIWNLLLRHKRGIVCRRYSICQRRS